MKKRGDFMLEEFRRANGGGGNRHGAREIAAKQLGSQAAKVGRHCGITDECPTRGSEE